MKGGASVLDKICSLACNLAACAPSSPLGIGVGTAGRVDAKSGDITYANDLMPGWGGQPLASALHERSGLPAAVLNDVQAYAVGEARWGAGRGADTCIMIAAGTGVGGAVIAHGLPYRARQARLRRRGWVIWHLPSPRNTLCMRRKRPSGKRRRRQRHRGAFSRPQRSTPSARRDFRTAAKGEQPA